MYLLKSMCIWAITPSVISGGLAKASSLAVVWSSVAAQCLETVIK